MSPAEYEQFRLWLSQQTGIHLDAGKEYLVLSRLKPVCDTFKIGSIGELIQVVISSPYTLLHHHVVDAMVTPETSFFRDGHPFISLRNVVIPQLIQLRERRRALRIWCAAAASGQEPYSMAILLREYFPETHNWDIRIVATDLSESMLERCRMGEFSQQEVNRGMPTPLLLKYFRQDGSHWKLSESIRTMVEFRHLNLIRTWPPFARFDLILMRNVMIYFDVPTKRTILEQIEAVLQPDGFLILGGAETTMNLNDKFERVTELKSSFYQLKKRDDIFS